MTTHARYCVSQWHPTRSDCTCGDVETSERLSRLGQNLAMGAALCEAFADGFRRGFARCEASEGWRDAWRPNTDGRPAPGWEGQR